MIDLEIDILTRIRRETERSEWELVRATPRGEHQLLLTLSGEDGSETAAQWYSDPRRCEHAARATAGVAAPGAVGRVGPHLLVQRRGADRRLPALHDLVRQGASLLAHRPERRGVVTHTVDAQRGYTKVVRPERLPAMLATLRAVAGTSPVRVPALLGSDLAHGTVTMAELPGRTLHDLLADLRADPATLRAAGAATGRAVRQLHRAPARAGRPVHDAAAELRVVQGWTGVAAAHGLLRLPHTSVTAQLQRTAELLVGSPSGDALLHRDLHDKQILIADEVGLLDLDLAAVGHPALDLANLQVHLELRVHQGVVTPERAKACVEGVMDGYAPEATATAGMRGYGLATRLRLLAVYAFRPHSSSAASRLLTHPLFKETS